ncbi:MAG: hypothetical protein IKD00_06870 [Candidatus Methanomethylophilaceae archaeon]|nr:hypothetical protein [Candidatus Methanomethylophilaceae archaeon]
MSKEDIRLLEERHVISTVLYIRDHPGCKKSELYPAVSKNPRMPQKLELLVSMGLVTMESREDSSATFLDLTDKGRRVAEHLSKVANIL